MERNIDLENLKQEDFIEIARYCHNLELRLEECKANALAIVTQRNNSYKEVEYLKEQLRIAKLPKEPTKVKLNEDFTLVNPEQYREKKQF